MSQDTQNRSGLNQTAILLSGVAFGLALAGFGYGIADRLGPARQDNTAAASAVPVATAQNMTVAQPPLPVQMPAAPSPDPVAELTSDDIDIFYTDQADVMAFAFIRPSGQWMRFDATGNPTDIDAGQVPADIRVQAETRARAGTPTSQLVGDPAQQAAQAEASLPALTNPGSDLAINQLLADPEIASGIVSALDQLGSIHVPGASSNTTVYVFYDPRCPYCHGLFRALDGKVDMVWLPTIYLGDTPAGQQQSAAILGNVTETADAQGRRTVALEDDAGRLDRLRRAMNGESLPPGTLSEAGRYMLDENLAVLTQLYGRQPEFVAVPTSIQLKPDGSAVAYRGYHETITAQILDLDAASGSASNGEGAGQ